MGDCYVSCIVVMCSTNSFMNPLCVRTRRHSLIRASCARTSCGKLQDGTAQQHQHQHQPAAAVNEDLVCSNAKNHIQCVVGDNLRRVRDGVQRILCLPEREREGELVKTNPQPVHQNSAYHHLQKVMVRNPILGKARGGVNGTAMQTQVRGKLMPAEY